jgi:predicted glutamine amidotransferase
VRQTVIEIEDMQIKDGVFIAHARFAGIGLATGRRAGLL